MYFKRILIKGRVYVRIQFSTFSDGIIIKKIAGKYSISLSGNFLKIYLLVSILNGNILVFFLYFGPNRVSIHGHKECLLLWPPQNVFLKLVILRMGEIQCWLKGFCLVLFVRGKIVRPGIYITIISWLPLFQQTGQIPQPAYAIMKQIQIYANLGKFKRQKYLNSNKGIIYFEFIKHYVKTVY